MGSRVLADIPPDAAAGTLMRVDDQDYELVENEPYTRRSDGQGSRLLTWETRCPVAGCGEGFRLQSGPRISGLRRRCNQHIGQLRPVKGRRGRKMKIKVELA